MAQSIEEMEREADAAEAEALAFAVDVAEQIGDAFEARDTEPYAADVVTVPDHRTLTEAEAVAIVRGKRGDHLAAHLEAEAREGVATVDVWTREDVAA